MMNHKMKTLLFIFIAFIGSSVQKAAAEERSSTPQLQVLSWSPRIFLIENFLTSVECDLIIEKAKPLLSRSTVVDDHDLGGALHEGRTSQGMFFPKASSDMIIRNIEKRIAALTMLPEENGEGIQVLSYGPGAEYQPHYDYFDPATPGGKACYDRGGQRIATLIIYLHTTEEGGETIFPKARIGVRPIKGNAVLFYNCTPDGIEDPLSFHGGAPVKKGEKWIATKWIRKGVFN
ncbi:MAG: 2OG-Fe(II) oxygenase [Parachlamydiales bacterium]|nr:2OG-Fe(II) oxygenase [Candidatus Acheromyda pituitae]